MNKVLKGFLNSAKISLKYIAHTATKVPRCRTIEKNSPPSETPNTRIMNARCPLEDTGRNSVRP